MAPVDEGAGAAPTGTAEGEAAPPSAAELADLRAAKQRLQQLEQASSAAAVEAARLKTEAAREAEAKGELSKALGMLKQRNAELEPLEAKARAYDALEAAELKSIEARKAQLPEAAQRALDGVQGLEAKRLVLAAVDSQTSAASMKPGHKPVVSTGAGAPTTKVDFGTITDRATLRTAIAADPSGWAAFKSGLSGAVQSLRTTAERRRAAQQPTKG